MQNNKLLPHDLKAEQNVLGAILINPNNHNIFADLNDILEDNHFFHALHIKIYQSMIELHDKYIISTLGC